MSHFTTRKTKLFSPLWRTMLRHRSVLIVSIVGLVLATGITTAVLADAGSKNSIGALDRTGELNAMGMPVVETPGSGAGRAEAAGVVVEGASWELGQVPLNVAVRPTWTLRNSSDRPVILGEPRPEVREGCCPGPVTLGTRTLAPGEAMTLTFELSMHPGMDGPHDLGVHVPVDGGTGTGQLLTLDVSGDFRN
jgi:hypothetical protein